MSQQCVPRVKLVTIGDSMTGKSCLVKRFCEGKFYDRFKPTIGIDYGTRKFPYKQQKISVDFWDMSGHHEFEEIRCEFYGDTQICFFVFDCSDKESFANLQNWIDETRKYKMPKDAVKYVVCNKVDSRYRVISAEQANEWCEEHSSECLRYHETSSKSGRGVQELFASVFEEFLK